MSLMSFVSSNKKGKPSRYSERKNSNLVRVLE